MNKILKIIALLVIIAALAFVGYKAFQKPKTEETEIIKADANVSGKEESKGEAAIPVKAMPVQRGDLPLRLNISATADVHEKASIRSEVSGTVQTINVAIGQVVSNGQLLLKVDDTEKRLTVERCENEKLRSFSQYLTTESDKALDNAQLTEKEKQDLLELKNKQLQAGKDLAGGKISQAQYDKINETYQKALIFSGDLRDEVRRAQEGLSAAIVSLKQAQLDLRRTQIVSPFPGVIAEVLVSKGEKISMGQELFKVVNLNTLYLTGYALEAEIAKLKKGTRVRVRFDSFPEETVYGELEAISPEIDPAKKTINIYVKLANPEHRFLPGMHAEIDIEHQVIENVMKVPQKAVIPRQGRYLVFVVRDLKGTTGTAYWEYVEIGNQNDEEIEIKSDAIKEGDLVLVDGHFTLAHQSRVKITE